MIDTARQYFTKALSYDPTNADFRQWKAAAPAESGYPDEAIYLYNQSVPIISSIGCNVTCATCKGRISTLFKTGSIIKKSIYQTIV